jgi:hypothetical protein
LPSYSPQYKQEAPPAPSKLKIEHPNLSDVKQEEFELNVTQI